MATITSAQSGNFTDTATWVGGVVPGSADIAVAATSHVVSIDTDVTVTEFRQAGTGKFTLGNGRTITGTITGNAGTIATGGTVEFVATTSATINGNTSSASINNSVGVVVTGSGSLAINGTLTSGQTSNVSNHTVFIGTTGGDINVTGTVFASAAAPGNGGNTITMNAARTVNVIGQLRGTTTTAGSSAVSMNASGTLNVTGSIIGSSTSTVGGNVVQLSSGATNGVVNVTGPIQGGAATNYFGISVSGTNATVSVIGSATAGSGAGSNAISSGATTNGVTIAGDMTDSPQGTVAVYTRLLRVTPTLNSRTVYYDASAPTGASVVRASLDVAGDHPIPANVRKDVSYAYNQFKGTLALPSPNVVRNGVPVGNTTGTGALTIDDIASVIATQITGGLDS